MLPADLPAAALAFANQLSEMDVDVDYVTLRFDSQTKELGLTYSDGLKAALGLGSNHYTLVSPATAGTGDTGGGGGGETTDDSAGRYGAGLTVYRDMFTQNMTPLALPLPSAYALTVAVLDAAHDHDHVVISVSSHDWAVFYSELLTAGARFNEFFDTARNVQQRFGFASSPAHDLPEVSVIRAGESYAPIGDWVGRYDQVYTSVLVMRFAAGTVPEDLLS